MKNEHVTSYQERHHGSRPHRAPEEEVEFVDYRDSFSRVYMSSAPFLFAEYVAETSLTFIPSGLVFPMGFLLFWAFYYTYYEPSYLESRLRFPVRWNWTEIMTTTVGVAIWFVKVNISEVRRLVRFVTGVERKRAAQQRTAASIALRVHAGTVRPEPVLPDEVITALGHLGLSQGVQWDDIHQRYRYLAKRYHPDLHPEITSAGSRFMRLDMAYRRLAHVRHRYFQQAR